MNTGLHDVWNRYGSLILSFAAMVAKSCSKATAPSGAR